MRRSVRAAFAMLVVAIGALMFMQPAFASNPLPATIQNGDFSQRMAAWFTYSWDAGASTVGVEDGVAVIDSAVQNDARLKQELSLAPDTVYCVSVDVLTENVVRMGDQGAGIGFDMTGAFADAPDDTGGWQRLELYVQTGPAQSSATLNLTLGGYGNEAYGRALFDNVTIEEAEAPEGARVYSLEPLQFDDGGGEDASEDHSVNYPGDFIAKVLFAAGCAAFAYAVWRWTNRRDWAIAPRTEMALIVGLMAVALIARAVILVLSKGYPNDTQTFAFWTNRMTTTPPSQFYAEDVFCDYPPGMLYLLGMGGWVAKFLGITVLMSGPGLLLMFLPVLICDIATAFVAWRYAREKCNQMQSLGILILLLFLPVLIYDSAVWHQVDSVMALFLVLSFWRLERGHKRWAAFFYAIALLCKPQALIAGPVFALPYLFDLWDSPNRKKAWADLGLGVGIALVTLFGLAFPFKGNQPWYWLVQKYFDTATSYAYGSVNAFNFWALMGGNFVDQNTLLGPLSFVQWANIMTVLSVAATVALYAFARKRGKDKVSLFLIAAFLFAMVFAFGPRMHERYSYPVLIFLPLAYVAIRDKGLINTFCYFSATIYFNMSAALYALNDMNAYTSPQFVWTMRADALLTFMVTVFLATICFEICVRGRIYHGEQTPKSPSVSAPPDAKPHRLHDDLGRRKPLWTRTDALLLIGLTVSYAIVAFVQLGTTQVPQTYWRNEASLALSAPDQAIGRDESIRVRFDGVQSIKEVWVYSGISEGKLKIASSGEESFGVVLDDNGNYVDQPASAVGEESAPGLPAVNVRVDYDVMYRWNITPLNVQTDELWLETIGDAWINEVVFVDSSGNAVVPLSVQYPADLGIDAQSSVAHLFDETDMLPARPDRTNGMYFDELYHGRTAYEHLRGLTPYENTHPPLGKILIMLGITLFGMNPFGWRCVGTLIGVLMIPVIYAFAKRLLKQTRWAFFVALLFAFDFMHYVQTRIATIDVYGVFFILLMYYFMLAYWQMNFYDDGLKKTLRPLALSGLMFGLGAASKWICIYAGGGLAVILFTSLAQRGCEFLEARSDAAKDVPGAAERVERTQHYGNHVLGTLICCVIAFVIVPIAIYIASYAPYFLCADKPYSFKGVIEVQQFMLRYHSNLTSRHSFESQWWTWPLILRPIFYYSGNRLPEGIAAGISAFGNPAVWWTGLVGLIALIVRGVRRKSFDNSTVFLLIAFGAQFVPWMFISRATFIYHYFASVPFIVLALAYVLQSWSRRSKDAWPTAVAIMCASVLLFAVFYPELSGLPVPRTYLEALQWLPRWTW